MTKAVYNEAIEFLSDFGEIREHYSGRGMQGGTCLGVVVDDGYKAAYRIALAVGEIEGELAEALRRIPKVDGMGMDQILYWPAIRVEANATGAAE